MKGGNRGAGCSTDLMTTYVAMALSMVDGKVCSSIGNGNISGKGLWHTDHLSFILV